MQRSGWTKGMVGLVEISGLPSSSCSFYCDEIALIMAERWYWWRYCLYWWISELVISVIWFFPVNCLSLRSYYLSLPSISVLHVLSPEFPLATPINWGPVARRAWRMAAPISGILGRFLWFFLWICLAGKVFRFRRGRRAICGVIEQCLMLYIAIGEHYDCGISLYKVKVA